MEQSKQSFKKKRKNLLIFSGAKTILQVKGINPTQGNAKKGNEYYCSVRDVSNLKTLIHIENTFLCILLDMYC